jgi:hypothetical protein
MKHDDAIRNNAVARYLLDEMGDAEVEQYEAHFFECRWCAQEIKVGAEFMESLRVALASPTPPVSQVRRCRLLIRIYGTRIN